MPVDRAAKRDRGNADLGEFVGVGDELVVGGGIAGYASLLEQRLAVIERLPVERVGNAESAARILLGEGERDGQEPIVPLVLRIVLVHRQRQTGFHELAAETEPAPHEVDIGPLLRAGRNAHGGFMLISCALFDFDRHAGIGVLELLDDFLPSPIGGIICECQGPNPDFLRLGGK